MGFAFDTPVDPYADGMTESDIDTWWASKDRTMEHGWDDADGYIRCNIVSSIGKGHTCKWGVNDAGTSYYLTINGPTINKSWT